MLLTLVDQATAPVRSVIDQVKRLEDTAKGAHKAMEPPVGGGMKRTADDFFAAQRAAESYQRTIDGLIDRQARLSQSIQGLQNVAQTAYELGAPIRAATGAAVEFERQIVDLKAAGAEGSVADLQTRVLGLSKGEGVDWRKIVAGNRAFLSKGGAQFAGQLSQAEPVLLKIAEAAKAEATDIYLLYLRYLQRGLASQEALTAIKANFAQGKAGSFELRDMAKQMPRLLGEAGQLGLTPQMLALDLPAFLQLPGEDLEASAATQRVQRLISDLSNARVREKLRDEFGIDAGQMIERSRMRGANPLFDLLNAIADRFKAMDPVKANEALSGVFGNMEARQAAQQWIDKRGQIGRYMPSRTDAERELAEAYALQSSTTDASARALAAQREAAAITLGTTQLSGERRSNELKGRGYSVADSVMQLAPGMTGTGATLWNAGSEIASFGATAASYWQQIGLAATTYALASQQSSFLSRVNAGVGGWWNSVKGASVVIGDLGKGVSDAVAETPGAAQALKSIGQSLARGVVLGAGTLASQYAIDAAFAAAPKPMMPEGYDPVARLNEGTLDRLNRVWRRISGADVAEKRAHERERLLPSAGGAVAGSPFEGVKTVASETGEHIQSALNVTVSPDVNLSRLEQTRDLVNEIRAGLAGIGSLTERAAAAVRQSSNLIRSPGALHDGFETR